MQILNQLESVHNALQELEASATIIGFLEDIREALLHGFIPARLARDFDGEETGYPFDMKEGQRGFVTMVDPLTGGEGVMFFTPLDYPRETGWYVSENDFEYYNPYGDDS